MKTVKIRSGVIAFEFEDGDISEKLTYEELSERGWSDILLKLIRPYLSGESVEPRPSSAGATKTPLQKKTE